MSGESIQHFIDSGDTMEVCCENGACRHHAPLDMIMLREKLGSDHGVLFGDLAHKLRCSKCGGKKLRFLRHAKGNEHRNMGGAHGRNPYEKAKGW